MMLDYIYMFIIAGLGNPDQEYAGTRHNTGRMMLEAFRIRQNLPEWQSDKKSNSLISKGEVGEEKVVLVEPETYMNKSGSALAYLIKTKKAAEKLIDDAYKIMKRYIRDGTIDAAYFEAEALSRRLLELDK